LFGNPVGSRTTLFSLSGGIGVFYGTSYEVVYKNAGKKEYKSELLWNIKPLLYMSINLDYELKEKAGNNAFLSASD
jgi:outer membrane protease